VPPPIITLLTDFGTTDAYVGIMKGVILGICAEARIIDLTHGVSAGDIVAGALLLRSAVGYFPPGTIHVAVVDPGVGSKRTPLLIETTPTTCLVGPDNGVLRPAAQALGIEHAVALTRTEYHLANVSPTFHGRDVFAPVAAHLAAGVPVDRFGPVCKHIESPSIPAPRASADGVTGEVVHVDRFGNLLTNITAGDLSAFPASSLSVSIAGCAPIPLAGTYSDVASGELVAVIGSWGALEVAERDGNAARVLGAGRGTAVHVRSV
jgi:S-adenosylmethionine hydrolase